MKAVSEIYQIHRKKSTISAGESVEGVITIDSSIDYADIVLFSKAFDSRSSSSSIESLAALNQNESENDLDHIEDKDVILKQGSSKAMAISQNNLSLILYYPNGTEVSLNSSSSTGTDDSDIIHVYCEEYEIYKINKQLFGNWNYSITSTYNNSREYLLMVNANTSTKFKILTEKTNYYTGEHVKINANLYNSTLDIEGANVTAYLTRPDKTTYNITLNDIGNGYYEGNFVNLFQNGIYEILVEAKKDDVIRQENFEFEMESIVNGGFETGDVSGWTVSSGGNGPEYYSEYEVAKEHNYSGNYGCELNISCALYGSSFISLTQNINLTNVAAVNFSHQCTYYYSNDGGRVRLQFYVDDNMTVIPLSDNVWK